MAVAVSDSISALYLSVLGRPADPASLAADVAAVDAGLPLAQIAITLATSPEAAADLGSIYENELGRTPDSGGVAADVQDLANGGSLAAIKASVAQSPEAVADLTAIYQDELGRAPDASGLASYQAFLANGGSLAAVKASVAQSPEAVADLMAIYQDELGRAPDASGLASHQAFLATGGSLAAVRASIAASPEAQADLANLEATLLDRPTDAGGLAAYTSLLAHGGTLSEVSASIVRSPELTADLTRLYQGVTGSGPDAIELAADQSELDSGASVGAVQAEIVEVLDQSNVFDKGPVGLAPLTVTPQTVAGPPIAYVYGAGNDDAVVTANPLSAAMIFYAPLSAQSDVAARGGGSFTGFNPATDYIQIQSYQTDDSIAASPGGTGSTITLGDGAQIDLVGIAPASLQGSDFRVSPSPTGPQNEVADLYQTTLGRPADGGGLDYYTQYLAHGGTVAGVRTALGTSAEAAGDISDAHQAALGQPADAVEVAAGQSELASGLPFTILAQELGELSGGAPPQFTDPTGSTVEISPQTIGGGPPNLVYGLASNDALIASQPESVGAGYENSGAPGGGSIVGFNPASDIIQIQASQLFSAPVSQTGGYEFMESLPIPAGQGGAIAYIPIQSTSGSAVLTPPPSGNFTLISLRGGASIGLPEVPGGVLTAANFRIV